MAEIAAVIEGAQYWVDMVKPTGTTVTPVVFEIYIDGTLGLNANGGTNGFYITDAVSQTATGMPDGIIIDGIDYGMGWGDEDDHLGHATINIGEGWIPNSGNQTASGRSVADLTSVIIHEMGHAMGIADDIYYDYDLDYGGYDLYFDWLTRYNAHLRDINGDSAAPGKSIANNPDPNNVGSGQIFDIGPPGTADSVTFVGENVLELWYGKPVSELTQYEKSHGLPILSYVGGVIDLGGSLSHVDIANTLMSWEPYRNYSAFIEIVAMLQDMGYDIERKNFFGKSFYQDGVDADGDGEMDRFYNEQRFGYWDATNDRYDMSRPNTATYAIGTHLFANDLNVFQKGDIWANGPGAAGVRIDGTANQFTLMSQTKITTDGRNGIGILTAYGKDHTVTLQKGSSVHASGPGGIGVSFDFGLPTVGAIRGSYGGDMMLVVPPPEDPDNPPEEPPEPVEVLGPAIPALNGSLVTDFNVSGTITGSKSRHNGSYTTGQSDVAAIRNQQNALLGRLQYTQDEINAGVGETMSWLDSRPFEYGAAIHIDETAAVDRINIIYFAYAI